MHNCLDILHADWKLNKTCMGSQWWNYISLLELHSKGKSRQQLGRKCRTQQPPCRILSNTESTSHAACVSIQTTGKLFTPVVCIHAQAGYKCQQQYSFHAISTLKQHLVSSTAWKACQHKRQEAAEQQVVWATALRLRCSVKTISCSQICTVKIWVATG